jgi:hypothetical protein
MLAPAPPAFPADLAISGRNYAQAPLFGGAGSLENR